MTLLRDQDKASLAVIPKQVDIRETKFRRRTGGGLLQQGLQVARELEDVLWRPGPEDETVPRVREPGLDVWPLEPQEKGVDEDPLEVGRQELVPLLRVPRHPVGRVE